MNELQENTGRRLDCTRLFPTLMFLGEIETQQVDGWPAALSRRIILNLLRLRWRVEDTHKLCEEEAEVGYTFFREVF